MTLPGYWWFARFAQYAIFLAIALMMLAMIGPLWASFYVWLVTDEWRWMPFNRWMRSGVLGAIGGVVMGASLTNYEWLVHTRASLLRKTLTTSLVVLLCIAVIVFSREHVGRLLR